MTAPQTSPPPPTPDRGGKTSRLPSGTSFGPQAEIPKESLPDGAPASIVRPRSVGKDRPGTESHPTANPNFRGRDPDAKKA